MSIDYDALNKYIRDLPKRVARWSRADREAFAEATGEPVIESDADRLEWLLSRGYDVCFRRRARDSVWLYDPHGNAGPRVDNLTQAVEAIRNPDKILGTS